MIAGFKITFYTAIFIIQVPCFIHLCCRNKIVEEFGEWGRSVTNALAQIVE